MRNEDPVRGTRIWNGERNTLRPGVNSVIIRGNEDPPCVHMGSDKSKCIGNYPLVTGTQVIRLLANEMSVRAL